MKIRTIVGLVYLLGALLAANGAGATVLPPADAAAAAEACKASWSAKPEIADAKGIMHAEFIRPSDSVLCMRGIFSRDTPRKIEEIADPAAIKSLVVNSDGGWTEAAIELAKLAERHHWLIVVAGRCFSSCANYVFLSRTEKVVLPRSSFGWHGLPKDPSEFDVDEFEKEKPRVVATFGPEWADLDARTALSYWVHSKEFLAERGIPPELCRSVPQTGHSKDYVSRLNSLSRSGVNPAWSYGKEVLEKKYNVRGILYMWEPNTPEEGTDLAMKQYHAQLFYFGLSSR